MTNDSEGLCYPDGKAFLLQKAAGLGGPKHRVLLMDKAGALLGRSIEVPTDF